MNSKSFFSPRSRNSTGISLGSIRQPAGASRLRFPRETPVRFELTPTLTVRSEPFAMGTICSPGSSSTENAGTTDQRTPVLHSLVIGKRNQAPERKFQAELSGALRANTDSRGEVGDVVVGAHTKRRWREWQRLVLRFVHGIHAVALRIVAVRRGSRGRSVRRQIKMEIRLVVLPWLHWRNVFFLPRCRLPGPQETANGVARAWLEPLCSCTLTVSFWPGEIAANGSSARAGGDFGAWR